MEKTICDKCRGPIIQDNGNYVCALCGAQYGEIETCVSESIEYTHFFETVSLESFRKISNRLSNSIACWGDVYLLAALSNGQFYSRFTPKSKGYDSVYRGQCAAENWIGVERIYAEQGYTIGITGKGELQPTLKEHQQVIDWITKWAETTDMRMRQVLQIKFDRNGSRDKCSFIGLDMSGNVFIHNPFEAFTLDVNDPDDVKTCQKIIQKIKKWPALKSIGGDPYGHLYGIADDGKVHSVTIRSFCEKDDKLLRSWSGIEAIDWLDSDWYGLKKNGTLVSNKPYDIGKAGNASTEIVQIRAVETASRGFLMLLMRDGRLNVLFAGKVTSVAANVVALYGNGYVSADGSLYEVADRWGASFKEVPNVRLFHNVETLEEEWAETIAAAEEAQLKRKEIEHTKKLKERELSKQQARLFELKKERENLGLFRGKEKKALDQQISELSIAIGHESVAVRDLYEAIKAIPDGRPVWNDLGPISEGTPVSMAQISAAAHQAIAGSGKKNHSVIKDATIGAVIAGPAGAIVGAIYAADKNRKK